MDRVLVKGGTASCNLSECCGWHFESKCDHRHDEPLDGSLLEGRAILEEWALTARHLGRYIQPGRLHLSFICDAANIETARIAAASIALLPRLAVCNVRLARHRDGAFRALAQETALRGVGRSPLSTTSSSFPFLALPTELRLRVFEYTDLVAPMRGCLESDPWLPHPIPTLRLFRPPSVTSA